MDADATFDAIAQQRSRLIELLASLEPPQWDAASLCDGWRVRDVVGHLLSVIEIPVRRFTVGVIRARNFHRYANRVALEFGRREPAELLDGFRALADRRVAPPVIGPIAPLTDLHIHTLDIARPLDRRTAIPDGDAVAMLTWLCSGRAAGFVRRKQIAGLRFEAPELGWASGDGPEVRGDAASLLMAMTGRRRGLADLDGVGVGDLARRLV